MANGQPVIVISGKRRRVGHGVWTMTGTIALSASEGGIYNTSVIEKYFRRCNNIHVSLNSGALIHWNQSTAHLNGRLEMYNSTASDPNAFLASTCGICSGRFVATGM